MLTEFDCINIKIKKKGRNTQSEMYRFAVVLDQNNVVQYPFPYITKDNQRKSGEEILPHNPRRYSYKPSTSITVGERARDAKAPGS